MKLISIISDSHGFLGEQALKIVSKSDEIWHSGDFGYNKSIRNFVKEYKIKGVYGNIDGKEIRSLYPKINKFQCENVKVLITHIGGYPNKYNKEIEKEIKHYKPNLFICGHSHILKVIYDSKYKLLHINPGAIGKEGFHKKRTIINIKIDKKRIYDLEVFELGLRSQLTDSVN